MIFIPFSGNKRKEILRETRGKQIAGRFNRRRRFVTRSMRNAIICTTACTGSNRTLSVVPLPLPLPLNPFLRHHSQRPTLTRGEMQRDYILGGKLLLKWFRVKRNGARTNCSRRLFNSWNSLRPPSTGNPPPPGAPRHSPPSPPRVQNAETFRVSWFKNGRFVRFPSSWPVSLVTSPLGKQPNNYV